MAERVLRTKETHGARHYACMGPGGVPHADAPHEKNHTNHRQNSITIYMQKSLNESRRGRKAQNLMPSLFASLTIASTHVHSCAERSRTRGSTRRHGPHPSWTCLTFQLRSTLVTTAERDRERRGRSDPGAVRRPCRPHARATTHAPAMRKSGRRPLRPSA